jgi:hypothetical protein
VTPTSPSGGHGRGPRLYVGGVPDEITEDDIVEHFNKWGQVVDCYFPGRSIPHSCPFSELFCKLLCSQLVQAVLLCVQQLTDAAEQQPLLAALLGNPCWYRGVSTLQARRVPSV